MSLQKYKPLAIERSTRLTKGQEKLFILICEKVEKSERLMITEAREIYLNYVHRYMQDGIPHRYDYWVPTDTQGQYTSRFVPMTEEEVIWATSMWLTTNIGRLVLRGYLTVVPELQLLPN